MLASAEAEADERWTEYKGSSARLLLTETTLVLIDGVPNGFADQRRYMHRTFGHLDWQRGETLPADFYISRNQALELLWQSITERNRPAAQERPAERSTNPFDGFMWVGQ